MQLAPDNAISPLARPVVSSWFLQSFLVDCLYVIVCGHRAQDLCSGKRTLGAHAAPPEHRLRAVQATHAPAVPEHVSQLRVHPALEPVARGGQGSVRAWLRGEEREELPTAHQPVQARPRLDQPDMRPSPLAALVCGPLLEEAGPLLAPCEAGAHPALRLSSTTGGIGHISQNREVLRLNVRPSPGIPRCVDPPSSQDRKISSSFAALSMALTNVAPQEMQCRLCLPADVLPYLWTPSPQQGHLILGMLQPPVPRIPGTGNYKIPFMAIHRVLYSKRPTHFVRLCSWGRPTINGILTGMTCEDASKHQHETSYNPKFLVVKQKPCLFYQVRALICGRGGRI